MASATPNPNPIIIFLFILIMSSVAAVVAAAAGRDIFELYSREEMVELAGYGEDKLSTVLITGTLRCKTDSSSPSSPHQPSEPLSGALVQVKCSGSGIIKEKQARVEGITDEYGDFTIELPSDLHGIPNLDKACLVKVHRLPNNSPCQSAFLHWKQDDLQLLSLGNGIRTYTTGEIMFPKH
ncbi:hypothetical protein Dimus_017750 [Dionaea muscipula]